MLAQGKEWAGEGVCGWAGRHASPGGERTLVLASWLNPKPIPTLCSPNLGLLVCSDLRLLSSIARP